MKSVYLKNSAASRSLIRGKSDADSPWQKLFGRKPRTQSKGFDPCFTRFRTFLPRAARVSTHEWQGRHGGPHFSLRSHQFNRGSGICGRAIHKTERYWFAEAWRNERCGHITHVLVIPTHGAS